MGITLDAHPVGEVGARSPMVQRVPFGAGVDDARIGRLLDNIVGGGHREIIIIYSLKDQREGSRPSKRKGQHQLPSVRVG